MRGVFKKMQMLKTIVICKENSRTAQKRIGKRERGEQKKNIYFKKKISPSLGCAQESSQCHDDNLQQNPPFGVHVF